MIQCDANIKPFPSDIILQCVLGMDHAGPHQGILVDYAYPGSRTTIDWQETDRRNFRGEWKVCEIVSTTGPCVLPAGHRGNHAE